ncbi:hypothetical protein KQ945_17330 [Bacillus subtilis subsp. subtilis]|nr:hypothetical protein [Bacillus subtilis subsp. subtilis]
MLAAGLVMGVGSFDAAAAAVYQAQAWAKADRCDLRPTAAGRDRGPVDAQVLASVSDKVVALMASLASSKRDMDPLRFDNLCSALDVQFVPTSLPPPRAEPWNPNPAREQGEAYFASNVLEAEKISQFISLKYYTTFLSLEYSIRRDVEQDAAAAMVDGVSYADIGDRCPLRIPQLKQQLVAAGYSVVLFEAAPPDEYMAMLDQGPFYQFEHGNRMINVYLQGAYADQRRALDAQCVGSIQLRVSAR